MKQKDLKVEFNVKKTKQDVLSFGFISDLSNSDSVNTKKRQFAEISNEPEKDNKEKSLSVSDESDEMPANAKFVFHKNG
jgi:hypothetical protein